MRRIRILSGLASFQDGWSTSGTDLCVEWPFGMGENIIKGFLILKFYFVQSQQKRGNLDLHLALQPTISCHAGAEKYSFGLRST